MNIVIDFDWTLYDIAALKVEAERLDIMSEWLQGTVWQRLRASDYFYDDSLAWLASQRAAGHSLQLLSIHHGPDWGPETERFQKIKIAESGVGDYVDSVTVVAGKKAEHIGPLLRADQENIFIDDRPEELRAVMIECPSVQCIRMRRPGSKYEAEETPEGVLEVHSLADISAL